MSQTETCRKLVTTYPSVASVIWTSSPSESEGGPIRFRWRGNCPSAFWDETVDKDELSFSVYVRSGIKTIILAVIHDNISNNHRARFTSLRLRQRQVESWHTGKETFRAKCFCHQIKKFFPMARLQRSSPLQLRPCWYYWSKAIRTRVMPSGVNVNNGTILLLLLLSM